MCLSGIISTQAVNNQCYLDRQGHISVFHEKLGLIITGAGKSIVPGTEKIELGPADLGAFIRHHGWTLRVDPTARLVWPVRPFDPYANGPEPDVANAVGALSVPLRLTPQRGRYVRPAEQEIRSKLGID